MPLNPVQVAHVGEVIRPFLETFVLGYDDFQTFVTEYDALQAGPNALPEDGTVLTDAPGGTEPRTDAPQLTGAQVKLLRDRVATMLAVMTPAEFEVLIDKMVRDLQTVRRSR